MKIGFRGWGQKEVQLQQETVLQHAYVIYLSELLHTQLCVETKYRNNCQKEQLN